MIKKITSLIKNSESLNKRFGKKVVHVEAITFTHKKLKEHVKRYKSKCYCIGPVNFDYSDSTFTLNLSKKEFEKSLKENYIDLKNAGADIQLHLHLSLFPERISYKKKKEMIKSTYDFFVKQVGVTPKEIVFGWYTSDKDSRDIAKSFGLKVVDEHFHIYDWWLK